MSSDAGTRAKPGPPTKDYYVGVDLGQKRDHTVVSVIEKKNRQFKLVHLKQFPLGTEYTEVLEYLKLVGERFQTIRGYYIDRTGVGEVFVENARKYGLKNVQGIVLTMQQKQEVMTCLKQVMLEKRLHIPKDKELENEMNGEISELTSAGKTKFYHRSGTHDDRLWAVGLAVYGARYDIEPYHPVAVLGSPKDIWGRRRRPDWTDWVRKLRGDAGEDVYRQFGMTGVNSGAWPLSKLRRNLLHATLPAVRALPYDSQPGGPPKRICTVCGSGYVYESGKDSPCGHVKKDGTLAP